MDSGEYMQFWRSAIRAYPEISAWLNKTNDPAGTADAWERAFANVHLDHALDAIDAMLTGEVVKPQYGWSDLPRIVIQFCRDRADQELAEQRAEHEDISGRRMLCHWCEDDSAGFCVIWNPWFVRDRGSNLSLCEGRDDARDLWRAWRREHRGYSGMSVAVACCCESPGAVSKRSAIQRWESDGRPAGKKPAVTVIFDQSRMWRWTTGWPGELRGEPQPAVDTAEFEAGVAAVLARMQGREGLVA
jgi:hypothetical protein